MPTGHWHDSFECTVQAHSAIVELLALSFSFILNTVSICRSRNWHCTI